MTDKEKTMGAKGTQNENSEAKEERGRTRQGNKHTEKTKVSQRK